jgi:predicted TPR repeat methyltransferase/thioredoxin-like negative regulator of GroEL
MDPMPTTADAEALLRRAALMIDAGRTGAARPLLAAARRLAGPAAGLARLSVRLALQDGDLDEAGAGLDEAIDLAPADPDLRMARAELRQRLGNIEGATRDAAEAVILNSRDSVAKALLGVLMLQLGRPADAVACLHEAVAARPADPAFREALSNALCATGDVEAALATLEAGITVAPAVVTLRNAAILLCIRRRDFTGADRFAEAARLAGVADACTFGLRGHALSSLGRHGDAADAYADALKLGPNDPYVRHLVAASGHVPGAARAPDDYLRTVFDGYADRFESHLVGLGYRMPGLMRKALLEHRRLAAIGPHPADEPPLGPVLDLGCGTGLIALALGDLPIGPVTGVDLSAKMLAEAAAKGLYETLRQTDLMAVLAEEARWPLILAADVLCYFGKLDEVFEAVHKRLEPAGWFVLSVEELLPHHDGTIPGNGEWALLRQGRYAHSAEYLTRIAAEAGFRINRFDHEVVRYEADAPVLGFLAVLERTRHDG